MFTIKIGGGGSPIPVGVCASKAWSICSVCKSLRGSIPKGRNVCLPKNVHLGGSIWTPITFSFVDQSSGIFFFAQLKGGCGLSNSFPMSDMSMHSGDIRYQIRKLSEIAPNVRRFFRPPKFQGAGLPKVIPISSPRPRGTSPGKSFVTILPLAPKL